MKGKFRMSALLASILTFAGAFKPAPAGGYRQPYTGTQLRKIRARNGVGRPPMLKLRAAA